MTRTLVVILDLSNLLLTTLHAHVRRDADLEAIFDAIVRSRAHHLAVINFNLTDR